MGILIQKIEQLPYKSLIFNYNSLSNVANILFDNTGKNWDITSPNNGQLTIECGDLVLDQSQYCVIVTPIRFGNNHSINVINDNSITNVINIYCTENQSNNPDSAGLYNVTFQINFFNL